ncbi:hypothetical protein MKW92_000508 [Papaver armeniacum]|nr:hypothetical protein MKW92_000508 [Papaver armeniacum]
MKSSLISLEYKGYSIILINSNYKHMLFFMYLMEAYTRLQRIVHEANRTPGGYQSEKYPSDVDSMIAGLYFQPQNGNVAFVCGLDGWGFCIKEFAEFNASKLGATVAICRGLYEDLVVSIRKQR